MFDKFSIIKIFPIFDIISISDKNFNSRIIKIIVEKFEKKSYKNSNENCNKFLYKNFDEFSDKKSENKMFGRDINIHNINMNNTIINKISNKNFNENFNKFHSNGACTIAYLDVSNVKLTNSNHNTPTDTNCDKVNSYKKLRIKIQQFDSKIVKVTIYSSTHIANKYFIIFYLNKICISSVSKLYLFKINIFICTYKFIIFHDKIHLSTFHAENTAKGGSNREQCLNTTYKTLKNL